MSSLPQPQPAPEVTPSGSLPERIDDRAPLQSKLAYGAGGMASIFFNQLPKTLVTPIFVTALALSPTAVSLAMLVFRIYDAVTDPLMGWISDNTRTRWGRRRPYLFVGAILTGLALPAMWFVNPTWDDGMQLAWLIGCGLLLYTCTTIFAVPYESLNFELTPSYNERTVVTSYKAFFQKIAVMIVGWSWFITQLPYFADPVTGKPDTIAGAQALSIVLGLGIIATGLLPAFFVRERFYKAASAQPKVTLRDTFKYSLTNRPFLLLLGITVCFASSYYLSDAMGFYLRLYYVAGGDQALAAKIAGVQMTLMMILGIASIPFFAWLSRRIGKTWTLMTALLITLFGMVIKWWTYTPEYPWLSMANQIILAPSLTGIWQIVPSMTGDVADDDELKTRERREGAFASIFSWIVKFAFTAGFVLAGPLVEWCGFQVALGAAQTPDTVTTMRIVDTVIPSLLLIGACVLLLRYPLSPERMVAIRQTLEARRGRL